MCNTQHVCVCYTQHTLLLRVARTHRCVTCHQLRQGERSLLHLHNRIILVGPRPGTTVWTRWNIEKSESWGGCLDRHISICTIFYLPQVGFEGSFLGGDTPARYLVTIPSPSGEPSGWIINHFSWRVSPGYPPGSRVTVPIQINKPNPVVWMVGLSG